MTDQNPPNSQQEPSVRALLAQFDAEYQAAFRALHSFSQGSSQHKFISQKMENMSAIQGMLTEKIGKDEAARLVVDAMNKAADKGENNEH